MLLCALCVAACALGTAAALALRRRRRAAAGRDRSTGRPPPLATRVGAPASPADAHDLANGFGYINGNDADADKK